MNITPAVLDALLGDWDKPRSASDVKKNTWRFKSGGYLFRFEQESDNPTFWRFFVADEKNFHSVTALEEVFGMLIADGVRFGRDEFRLELKSLLDTGSID